jgi:predicted nucleotidyltransferase component of viral defense system
MKKNTYYVQTELMLEILPFVMKERIFSLKGGTAINFFYQDMPRLSVDIDLTFMKLTNRIEMLEETSFALNRISKSINQQFPSFKTHKKISKGPVPYVFKLMIQSQDIQIKIEPNLVLRGACFQSSIMTLCKKASTIFRQELECSVMSLEDIYAGKMCAALDRQLPRDLFDIKLLFDKEGITQKMMDAFVVYLASSSRPIAEMLNPNNIPIEESFERTFKGMTEETVSIDSLLETRTRLFHTIRMKLTNNHRLFLLSLKEGCPNYSLNSIPHVDKLPAVQWKLMNIKKMPSKTHKKALNKLRSVLEL